MGNLEVTVEEHLMDIFSMPGINERIANSGLRKEEYKQGLIDSLKKGEINQGKTVQETLRNYESNIKWQKFCDNVEGHVNRLVWAGTGVMLTAPFNYIITSPILYQLEKNNASTEERICTFAAFSLSLFIIEKRIGQGLPHYLERSPYDEKEGMKKRDYLRLLSGYILKEFSFTRKKGQEIIDFYSKNNQKETEAETNVEKEGTRIYGGLIKYRQAGQYSSKEKEAAVQAT